MDKTSASAPPKNLGADWEKRGRGLGGAQALYRPRGDRSCTIYIYTDLIHSD